MEFFTRTFTRIGSWIDRLFDQLVDWFGRYVKPFIEKLINFLKKIWKQFLEAALIAAYGFIEGLYVIFYMSKEIAGQMIAEFWDAKNPQTTAITTPIEDGTIIVPASVQAQLSTKRKDAKQFLVQKH